MLPIAKQKESKLHGKQQTQLQLAYKTDTKGKSIINQARIKPIYLNGTKKPLAAS